MISFKIKVQSSMSNCKIQNLYLSLLHTRLNSFRGYNIDIQRELHFFHDIISVKPWLATSQLFQCLTRCWYILLRKLKKLEQEFMIALIKLVSISAMSLAFWRKGPMTFLMLRKVERSFSSRNSGFECYFENLKSVIPC